MVKEKLTRGIRNNNPFNIIKSQIAWYGEVSILNGCTDKKFEQFYSMEYGYRAGIKLLYNYFRNGINSIRSVLSRFAPETENDLSAYVDFVASRVDYPENKPIYDFTIFILICKYICMFESQVNVNVDYLVSLVRKHLPYVENFFGDSTSNIDR